MYGFNLGQIEGLDSSVKTVELTLEREGQALSSTLAYNEEDGWWIDGTNHFVLRFADTTAMLWLVSATESNVGEEYNINLSTEGIEPNFKSAVETVLADNGLISGPETLFDGTITITDGPAEIPFDGDVSSYPIEKWTVTVNDEPLEYNGEVFMNETETHMYVVGNINGVYKFLARDDDGVIPGNYQVNIAGVSESGGSSGLPVLVGADGTYTLKATKSGGNVTYTWVLDT